MASENGPYPDQIESKLNISCPLHQQVHYSRLQVDLACELLKPKDPAKSKDRDTESLFASYAVPV